MFRKLLLKLITGFLLMQSFNLMADGYEIKFRIKGIGDTLCYLGYYYKNEEHKQDSIRLDKKGQGVFKGKKELPGGVYYISFTGKPYFDFLVGDDQLFSFETDTTNVVQNMKFSGSLENELYYNSQKFIGQKGKEFFVLQNRLRTQNDKPDSIKIINERLDKINQEVMGYWDKIKNEHSTTLFVSLVKSMEEPMPPEPPYGDNQMMNQQFQYLYYKEHYFDNVNFNEPRLVRTPFFHKKIINYFFKIIDPAPDTLAYRAIKLVEKAKVNKEMYKYILDYFVSLDEEKHMDGWDEVYIRLAEKYYLTGQTYWTDSAYLPVIKKRVEIIKALLVGRIAPDITLQTFEGKQISLHEVNAEYTILYFFHPDCPPCAKATPVLKRAYDKYKNQDIEIFAVYVEEDYEMWKGYIEKNNLDWINAWDPKQESDLMNIYDIFGTPITYILDRNKAIMNRKVSVFDVEQFLAKRYPNNEATPEKASSVFTKPVDNKPVVTEKEKQVEVKKTEKKDLTLKNKDFFDDIDFSDTTLLSNGELITKISQFLSINVISELNKEEQEELYKKAVDFILQKADKKKDDKMYNFILEMLVTSFERSDYEMVFKYLIEKHLIAKGNVNKDALPDLERKINEINRLATGQTALQIEMAAATGNRTVKLTDIQAPYTLLIFWESGCENCHEMMQQFPAIYDEYQKKGLEILAISVDVDKQEWIKAITEGKYKWMNYCDLKGWDSQLVKDYNVRATPKMYLLDKNKKIISKPTMFHQLKVKLKEVLD